MPLPVAVTMLITVVTFSGSLAGLFLSRQMSVISVLTKYGVTAVWLCQADSCSYPW